MTRADTPTDREIRVAALRRSDTFSVMDVVHDLGHNRLSLGTHAWHIIRDLVDEGLVTRSHDGYRVVASPEART